MNRRKILLIWFLLKRINRKRRVSRRFYVRPTLHNELGNFYNFELFYDAYKTDEELKIFCHFSITQFDQLYDLLRAHITHQQTHARPIPTNIRLAIFLRLLHFFC